MTYILKELVIEGGEITIEQAVSASKKQRDAKPPCIEPELAGQECEGLYLECAGHMQTCFLDSSARTPVGILGFGSA